MITLKKSGALSIGGQTLEFRHAGPEPDQAATIVLLHEGLGSAALWGDFPEKLSAATGAGVFAYSRAGYGKSSGKPAPWPVNYMHGEALEVLPRVLEAIRFQRGILLGHSDGASIATLYAGGVQDHRIRGLSLIAPHFIVEDVTIGSIAAAKKIYETGDLKSRLAPWHANVDHAFNGWSSAWLNPEFRHWDISESLAYLRVPVQIIQGAKDQYGTMRQIEIAREECYCPVDAVIIEGAAHAPHREAPDETLAAAAEFATRILSYHGEGLMKPAA